MDDCSQGDAILPKHARHGSEPVDVASFLQRICQQPSYRGQLLHVRELPAREGRFADPSAPLAPVLRDLLRRCGITQLYSHQVEALEAARSGRDLVMVSSPDYYFVKLIPVVQALERRPGPRRLRALSFGPVPLQVTRRDRRTLSLRFEGGILSDPILELYRDARLPMQTGRVIALDGLQIRIAAVTGDGRAQQVEFSFDEDLDADRFVWLAWEGDRYAPFRLPRPGETVRVAPARVPFGL